MSGLGFRAVARGRMSSLYALIANLGTFGHGKHCGSYQEHKHTAKDLGVGKAKKKLSGRALLADEPTTGLDAFQVPFQKGEKSCLGCQKGVVKTLETKKWIKSRLKRHCYDPGTCF